MFLGPACLYLAACVHVGQQQKDPWGLFTLSPLPESKQDGAMRSPQSVQRAISVGPIHLPAYLDQDQLVTRISQNRLTLSENDRWAEPLEDNIARVVAQDLSMLLQTDEVNVDPWPVRQRPAYQVEIEVLSFETDTAGTAHLVGRWSLRDVARRQTLAEKETRLTASGGGTSTEQSVASLSKALGDFSLAIAGVIRELIHSDSTQSTIGAGNRTSPTAAVSLRGPGP
jgi:uncharacterized lipoprotein YmbA